MHQTWSWEKTEISFMSVCNWIETIWKLLLKAWHWNPYLRVGMNKWVQKDELLGPFNKMNHSSNFSFRLKFHLRLFRLFLIPSPSGRCLFGSLGHLCFRPHGGGGQLSPFDKCDSDEEDGEDDDWWWQWRWRWWWFFMFRLSGDVWVVYCSYQVKS